MYVQSCCNNGVCPPLCVRVCVYVHLYPTLYLQDIVSINRTLEEKTLGSKPNLAGAFHHVKQGNGRLHLLGLVRCAGSQRVVGGGACVAWCVE